MDLISNIRVILDKYHNECYSETCQLAQKIESVPRTWVRETTRENSFPCKIPFRNYKLFLSISFIDTELSELKKRFERNQK